MLFLYAFPVVASFAAAMNNYLTVSFGVYLKYQAMVDSYYLTLDEKNTLTNIVDQKDIILKALQESETPDDLEISELA